MNIVGELGKTWDTKQQAFELLKIKGKKFYFVVNVGTMLEPKYKEAGVEWAELIDAIQGVLDSKCEQVMKENK